MHRSVLALAALSLVACAETITRETCDEAAMPGTWKASLTKTDGPDTCPTLTKSIEMPSGCSANCGCTESQIVFELPTDPTKEDRCAFRFQETCPGGQTLDCRTVTVESATSAAGQCFLKLGTVACTYDVEWSKQ
ncbi:MAG: hypothetical protein HY901_10965 [Deltaproteobacteria bacterium]|nr:hypothetical protein [Deltaproteobacteria bacterium]